MFAITQEMQREENSDVYNFIGVMQIVENLKEASVLITKFNDYFGFSTENDADKIDNKNRIKFQYQIYTASGGNPIATLWGVAP